MKSLTGFKHTNGESVTVEAEVRERKSGLISMMPICAIDIVTAAQAYENSETAVSPDIVAALALLYLELIRMQSLMSKPDEDAPVRLEVRRSHVKAFVDILEKGMNGMEEDYYATLESRQTNSEGELVRAQLDEQRYMRMRVLCSELDRWLAVYVKD